MTKFKLSFLVIMVTGYGLSSSALAADRVSVFVSIAPQAYFVQQIGKDLVDVQVLVEPGADPHTYEPKPRQMVALSKAALYFAVGIEFEKAKLGKITAVNPALKVVHTDHGILKLPMAAYHQEEAHSEEDREPQGETDTGHGAADAPAVVNRDPHIWLSPPLVMLQARSIVTALQAVDPVHRAVYETNYRVFIQELVDLDADLRNTFDGLKGSSFMVFHPSWGTFAHTYGIKQVAVEIEGKSPKPGQMKELIEHARDQGIKVVFVQPQFSSRNARQIAKAIDGQVVFVDPLAADWATNLRRTAEEFRDAFK